MPSNKAIQRMYAGFGVHAPSPHQRAAAEGGGVQIEGPRFQDIARDLKVYAPGCGSEIHVEGTNGGTMPCGATLTRFGKTAPYFCPACQANIAGNC